MWSTYLALFMNLFLNKYFKVNLMNFRCLHHCRFTLGNKSTILILIMGEAVYVWEQEVYGKSLYLSLNFVVKLKLL